MIAVVVYAPPQIEGGSILLLLHAISPAKVA